MPREVMQLFSIGLVQLNADGTPRLSNGQPMDSYSAQDISQLARVFTGWERDRADAMDYAHVTRPMKHNAANFQSGDKTVLGTTIPGSLGGPEALSMALDTLANHPNVGPFMGRQLIQRFTMSHPSPAYVGRVAAVFNNNGSGVRGDLKATLRAVLLDPEARASPTGNASGRLREPVQRFVQWGRTFGITSTSGRWPIGDTSDPASRLGQSPWRSPSVFNFFRPGYVPPGNELAANQITAPRVSAAQRKHRGGIPQLHAIGHQQRLLQWRCHRQLRGRAELGDGPTRALGAPEFATRGRRHPPRDFVGAEHRRGHHRRIQCGRSTQPRASRHLVGDGRARIPDPKIRPP